MTEEEMTIEAARSMMEHGIDSPRRTDLIWKVREFMRQFELGHRSPSEFFQALKDEGLEVHKSSLSNGDCK